MSSYYRWHGDDLELTIKVQPRASRDEIVGPLGDALKVRLTAPPVDGAANACLLRLLARLFGVSNSSVELLSGQSGKLKRVRIRQPDKLPDSAEIGKFPQNET